MTATDRPRTTGTGSGPRPGKAGLQPPPYLFFERLAMLEYGSFMAASPLLRTMATGDGHPVLFLPGLFGSDRSTEQLRTALRRKGHTVHGWRLGQNTGPHTHVLEGTTRRLHELHDRYGRTVSIVGWSLGGIFARELARQYPHVVRQVVTMAAPFRFRAGDRGNASLLYDMVGPREDPFPGHDVAEDERPPLEVPASAIYSRTDGIVQWHTCIDAAGPLRENIEVYGTHSGFGHNVAAALAIADRLAQSEGQWAPFRPQPALRLLYPSPATWAPAGPSPVL